MLRIFLPVLFDLLVEVIAIDCFTPNGTSRNAMLGYPEVALYVPCNAGAKHSMCCKIGAYMTSGKDTCTHDNMFCANGDVIWRESCTDPTWQDPACQKLFINGTGYPGAGISYDGNEVVTDVQITVCDDGVTYCSGYNNRACCRARQGVYLDSSGIQRATNPNTTSSGATSSAGSTTSSTPSSATSSSTSAASPGSSGLSTGAKAGIGAGVGIAVLAAIAIVSFLLIRRKRTEKRSVIPDDQQWMSGHGSPQSPYVEAPSNSGIIEKPGGNVYSDRAELDGAGRTQA